MVNLKKLKLFRTGAYFVFFALIFLYLPVVISFLYLNSGILSPFSVNAQQFAASIDPSQTEILSKPGVSLLKVFNFINQGDQGIFSLQVVSFSPTGEMGERQIQKKAEGPVRFSLENANNQLGDKFVLKTNEHFQALLKIRILDNAPSGDYYYLLLLTSEAPVSQSTASQSRGAVGGNILISVSNNGLTDKLGRVSLFEMIPRYKFDFFGKRVRIVDTGDEIPVIVKVVNLGKHKIVPQVAVSLRGPYTKEQQASLLPVNILRSSERLLSEQNSQCIRCRQKVSAVFKGFFLGKYTLTAEFGLEGATQKGYATIDFWGLPLGLLKILFILTIGCLIYWGYFKHGNKKQRKSTD